MKLECKVAGDFLPERQAILKRFLLFGKTQKVNLVWEHSNQHDPYAVAVLLNGKKIGFVPRKISEDVAISLCILKDSEIEINKEKSGKLFSNLRMAFSEEE